MTTWILVADGSRARIFSSEAPGSRWKLVNEFDHPPSRAKGVDLETDDRGRQRQSFGVGNRPAMEPTTAPKVVEADRFARELAQALDDAFNRREFDALALVAAPEFLGRLRSALTSQVAKQVVASIDKDYNGSDARELARRLDEAVHPAKRPKK
ncbi:MAG: host attachment protein [Pirellulales bacterium]